MRSSVCYTHVHVPRTGMTVFTTLLSVFITVKYSIPDSVKQRAAGCCDRCCCCFRLCKGLSQDPEAGDDDNAFEQMDREAVKSTDAVLVGTSTGAEDVSNIEVEMQERLAVPLQHADGPEDRMGFMADGNPDGNQEADAQI